MHFLQVNPSPSFIIKNSLEILTESKVQDSSYFFYQRREKKRMIKLMI